MNDPVETAPGESLPVQTVLQAPPPANSPWTYLLTLGAWVVIIALVILVALVQFLAEGRREKSGEDTMGLLNMKWVGRIQVGTKQIVGGVGAKPTPNAKSELQVLNTGPVDLRLRYLVLVGELYGPRKALEEIEALKKKLVEHHVEVTDKQTEILRILELLYGDYEKLRLTAPSVTPAQRDLLRTELDWFGELALNPAGLPPTNRQVTVGLAGGPAGMAEALAQTPNPKERNAVLEPAVRATVSMVCLGLLMLFGGFAGFVLLILVSIQWLRGKLQSGLFVGTQRGGIYAETFALWMVLFVAISALAIFLPENVRLLVPLLSLAALVWPRVWGVPWKHMLFDIGLTPGRQPVLEPIYGIACYLTMLPILVGVLLVLAIVLGLVRLMEGGGPPEDIFSPSDGPYHPAVKELLEGNLSQLFLVIVVGVVIAPVVEEIMFRGVLYRHLRELTGRWRVTVSVLVSGTVMGFIFAVIHPQGLVGVPGIMLLSFAFTLVREWRGTLIPGMVAHARTME